MISPNTLFAMLARSACGSFSRPATAGFTLFEMLVTLSVFVVITSTLLVSYSGLNKHLSVDTLAHEIGQWVRDAQVSAMSVKSAKTVSGVYPGYGVHFALSDPGKFIFFADILPPYHEYNALSGSEKCGDPGVECEREIVLTQGNKIDSLCGVTTGGILTAKCLSPNGASSVFDIVFTRPDPDAVITGNLNGGATASYSSARITIVSLQGYRRTIEAWITGQISIQ